MDFGSLESDYLYDLQLLINNEHVDQLIILKSLAKLVFLMMKQIAQFPFLFNKLRGERKCFPLDLKEI